jgi:hypothetical protein
MKTTPYASATSGTKARDEITKVLRRLGCESIGFMDDLRSTNRDRQVQFWLGATVLVACCSFEVKSGAYWLLAGCHVDWGELSVANRDTPASETTIRSGNRFFMGVGRKNVFPRHAVSRISAESTSERASGLAC